MHAQHSHVLIAGAGPVGMLAAVELARKGVEVAILDQDEGTSVRSYACLLHPSSVRLLEQAGMGNEILKGGIRIGQFEFVENGRTRWELHPGGGHEGAPAAILPQSDLEEILQQRLSDLGVEIHWRHRLTDLHTNKDRVFASVDILANSGKGYAVPHMDRIVSKTIQISADYLIGADGRDSHVRELLGIRQRFQGEPEFWAACEFEAAGWQGDDLHLASDQGGANMLARLPDGRARAMFQCAPEELDIEAHLKERVRFRIVEPEHDTELLHEIDDFLSTRFPQVKLEIGDIDWHGVMEVSKCLATRFGGERCWLAGDAAHMSSPIGMHSMNSGLLEAAEIARAIADPYSDEETAALLKKFNTDFHERWVELFAQPDRRKRAIMEMLPANGPELASLLRELDSATAALST